MVRHVWTITYVLPVVIVFPIVQYLPLELFNLEIYENNFLLRY
jgi:hypothetical protein